VPTWNYSTVHAWGRPQVIDDVEWIRGQVESLTGQQERTMHEPWSVSDAPEPYITAQLRGIVGIEIAITRIEGKWKVSQNRNDADRAGVAAGLLAGGEEERAMSALVLSRRDQITTDN
jgi:transcriptional regulator